MDKSIDEVIEIYSSMVYRIAITKLKSKYDAEDIFQEVFLKYVSKKTSFQSEEHRKAWLIRVTLNCCNKLWTYNNKKKSIKLDDNIPFYLPEESEIYNAITQLPLKYRMPIILFYFEDLTTEEIGKILKKKPATIRMRLTRGRNILKNKIKGDYFHE